jgi:hypothetical protein
MSVVYILRPFLGDIKKPKKTFGGELKALEILIPVQLSLVRIEYSIELIVALQNEDVKSPLQSGLIVIVKSAIDEKWPRCRECRLH